MGGAGKGALRTNFELVLAGGRREVLVLDVGLRRRCTRDRRAVDPDAIDDSRPVGAVTRHEPAGGSMYNEWAAEIWGNRTV